MRSARDVEYARELDRDRDGVDDRDERVGRRGTVAGRARFGRDREAGVVDRDAQTRVVEPPGSTTRPTTLPARKSSASTRPSG